MILEELRELFAGAQKRGRQRAVRGICAVKRGILGVSFSVNNTADFRRFMTGFTYV